MSALLQKLPRCLRRHAVIRSLIRLWPKLAEAEVAFNGGARLMGDLRDENVRQYFRTRQFEPEFFAIAAPFLSGGGVFFDVGANFGFCSFGLLAQPRRGRMEAHLFEANRELCRWLRLSAALHPDAHVKVTNACVTDSAGTSRLVIAPTDSGRSFVGAEGTQEVENLRLDDYCRQHGVREVAFAKLDIEGFEPRALAGARDLLAAQAFGALYVEVSPLTLRRHGYSISDVIAPLERAGYTLYFCKPSDLALQGRSVRELPLAGSTLPLAPWSPGGHGAVLQTDLLALSPRFNREVG